jgi:hypothetical protein
MLRRRSSTTSDSDRIARGIAALADVTDPAVKDSRSLRIDRRKRGRIRENRYVPDTSPLVVSVIRATSPVSSVFPSEFAYVSGIKVKGRHQSNLPAFMFAGGGAYAPGSVM